MLKKILKRNFASLLICLIASSCSIVKLKVPDLEACASMGKGKGAYCYTTLSGQDRVISPETWDKISIGRPSFSLEDFGEIEKLMRKACAAVGTRCDKDVKKTLKNLKRGMLKQKRYIKRARN